MVTILEKELRDALRDRWLWLFGFAFAVLALALGGLGLSSSAGIVAYSRTMAGLINLVLLLVPLFGLMLGTQSLAGERERRTLAYLLAQPIGRLDVLLGKYIGAMLGLTAALLLGFGLAGLILAPQGFNPVTYASLVGLALLLGFVSLSLGMLISVFAQRVIFALGIGLSVWFALVLLGDLGLMGTTLVLRLPAPTVFFIALASPLQVFKVAAVLLIRPDLEVLGPAGMYGVNQLGAALGPLLVALLILWTIVPLVVAGIAFRNRSEP